MTDHTDLIERLRDAAEDPMWANHAEVPKVLLAAASALASLPPVPQAAEAGWISVEDRLPEVDTGEVLVWLTGDRCAFDEWRTHHEDPTGLGGRTLDMGPMWRDYEFEDITHWMPLPAAPGAVPPAAAEVPARGERDLGALREAFLDLYAVAEAEWDADDDTGRRASCQGWFVPAHAMREFAEALGFKSDAEIDHAIAAADERAEP